MLFRSTEVPVVNGAYFNHARSAAANCGGGGGACTVNAMTVSMGRYEIIFTTVSDWNIRNAVIIVIPNDPFIIPIYRSIYSDYSHVRLTDGRYLWDDVTKLIYM